LAQEKFERFGNYILLEKLAAGGMAEIYLSKKLAAEGLQKFVAVKRILSQHSASEDFIRMFKDEAKIAVNISHSNVVGIHDFGVENKQLYLVMEYIEGKNLRQILNRLKQLNKRLSVSHIVYATKMIAAGLDHAHRLIDATTGEPLNIIHRDMSPQNVMVSFEGEVKIIDFGIAKSTTQEENTRVGTLKGKFGYMSPEQVDGLEVDARTDIFALGIMLWEMLSEQRLFLSNNEMTTLRKIRDCKIPSLRQIDPNVPIELEKIVNKSLTRNKTQRYQTAAELQKDLQSFLNRYNPDFSSQDFSEFIKETYAEEIIDARKRQVAYSKIDIPQVVEPQHERFHSRSDVLTQSMTYSKNSTEKMNFDDLKIERLGIATQPAIPASNNAAPQLGELSQSHLSVSKNPNFSNLGTPSKRQIPAASAGTGSIAKVHEVASTNTSSMFGAMVLMIALGIGGFGVLNEMHPSLVAKPCTGLKSLGLPLSCHQEGSGQTQLASKTLPLLKVTSDPIGAHIYINSKPTNQMTPAEVEVDGSKPFVLSLTLGGYQNETRRYNGLPPGNFISFKLTSIPSGAIIVRVVGGEAFLGSRKLRNGEKLVVDAKKEIVLTTVNPLSGVRKETRISVDINETKEVILSPR
jgi:eukaryotic-like serine/threonine-protein kinase